MKNEETATTKVLVLIGGIAQLTTPIFTRFDQAGTYNDPEIIPADYAFEIWGIITALGFLYSIYQVLPNRPNRKLHQRISRALLMIYLLFSAWLFSAQKNWLLLTVLIFIVMFILLVYVFQEILLREYKLNGFEKIVLEIQIGLYTGWSTVAIFANTAACLQFYQILNANNNLRTAIQAIILLAALINSVYFMGKFKFNTYYTLTILWAFVGVYFGIEKKGGSQVLTVITVGAIAIILALATLSQLKRQPALK